MITIGRIDKADFPELNLKNINVKIDTGAYTSTIHSHHIEEIKIDGVKYVSFKILDPTHKKYRDKEYRTKNFRKKSVKSSFGASEIRFVITTIIVLYGQEFPVELSLSERSDMKYPILLGRKLLKGRFVVDTAKKNISYKLKMAEAQSNRSIKNK
jgi:hypothetical protein